MSEPARNSGDDTRARLTQLLATVLWSSADHFADVFENYLPEADGQCPMVDCVELTEDGRIGILADGEEYVLSVEPRDTAPRHESEAITPSSARSPEEDFAGEVIEASKECGEMTLQELRGIFSILGNGTFSRYWINWFDPAPGSDLPALMALCAVNGDGSPVRLYERDMQERGFVKRTDPGGLEFWFVRRVDEEGNPWRSQLIS